jgi:ketosteroid isomerase-like protein
MTTPFRSRRPSMRTAPATITQAFERYVDTFQSLDPKAALRSLHVPTLIVDAQGSRVLSTEADAEAFLGRVMHDLEARGYARSAIVDSHVHVLSETLAVVSVSRIRYDRSGRELERLGETYTLRQSGGDWKIVVAVVHEATGVLRTADTARRHSAGALAS